MAVGVAHRAHLVGGLQQRARVLERGLGDRLPRQHARDLLDPLPALEATHRGDGAAAHAALLGQEVAVGQRRDLRHVRHAEDLIRLRQRAQLLADDLGDPAADAGVDLVEDERPPPPRRGRRRPFGSRAGPGRARRPTRSARAASPARPGWARRRGSRTRARRRAGRRRRARQRVERDAQPGLLEREARGAPSRPPTANRGAASLRFAVRAAAAAAEVLPGGRLLALPAIQGLLDVGEVGRLGAQRVRAAQDLGHRPAVLSLEARDLARARVSSAVRRSGSASIAPAASRAAAARSATRRLSSSASSRCGASRGSIAASCANARAASPSRSAAEPSSSESARRAASPNWRMRSACSSRSRSAGRSCSSASTGATASISRIWNSSISSRASRSRRESSSASSRARASVQRAAAAATASRSACAFAKASSSSSGAPAATSSSSAFWPWMARSASPTRARVRTAAGSSSTKARPRPSGASSRRRRTGSDSGRPAWASTDRTRRVRVELAGHRQPVGALPDQLGGARGRPRAGPARRPGWTCPRPSRP